jgi:hypothetical protein
MQITNPTNLYVLCSYSHLSLTLLFNASFR